MRPEARSESLVPLALMLVPILVGLAASTLLLVDYVRPAPVFCSEGGGCAHLRQSPFAYIAGVPLPVFGLSGFVSLGVLALLRGPRVRTAQLALATAAALVAAFLIAVQVKVGTFCAYCLAVDTSTLVVFALAAHRARKAWDPPAGALVPAAGALGMVAVVAIPGAIGAAKPVEVPGLPEPIAREIAASPKGVVTIVDFIDFECPFCRSTHEELAPLLAEHKGRVRVVRKQVPFSHIHPHANDAARAAHCGEALGRGDEMADALVATEVEKMTPDGLEDVAESVGLARDAFRACVADPATEARIQADREAFRAARGKGLPTIWVNDQKLEGAQSREELARALEAALARPKP
jgi:protein-disulfide isomerase